jgi:uncharacterized cysteine cluster protein YcgN (CxxCxxCC family)
MNRKIDTINEADWEKLCLRCGQCCHRKIKTKHMFIVDPTHVCEHLENNICTIYNDRLQPGKCIHIKEALEKDLTLPTSCPYTKLKPGYQGFVMPDQETFDNVMLICAIIEIEEERLGRVMTENEVRDLEITQEKIDAVYEKAERTKVEN